MIATFQSPALRCLLASMAITSATSAAIPAQQEQEPQPTAHLYEISVGGGGRGRGHQERCAGKPSAEPAFPQLRGRGHFRSAPLRRRSRKAQKASVAVQ